MQATRSTAAATATGWRLAGAVALTLMVAGTYAGALQGGFHFDDVHNIVDVPALQHEALTVDALVSAVRGAHLPRRVLANVSFALDWWRGGGTPGPFLVTNIVIHATATLAVFALFLAVLGPSVRGHAAPDCRVAVVAAFFGAAVWALHPIQVQSVAYIVQRMAALAGLFVVLSVLLFLWARTAQNALSRALLFVLAASCLLLGAASKENAVVAVMLIALAEVAFFRGGLTFFRTRAGVALASAAVALAALAAVDLWSGAGPLSARVLPGYELRDFTLGERLLTQPRVIAFHLSQILWPAPTRFSLEHDFTTSTGLFAPPSTALAMAGLALWCVLGVAALAVGRLRATGFFVLWVPVALSVESSVLALEMVFEHRLYLPSVGLAGLAALAAAALGRTVRRRTALLGAALTLAVVVPVALGTATVMRLPAWRSMLTVCQRSVSVAPASDRAWACLGLALLRDGRLDEAQAALDRAISLDARNPEALSLSGVAAMMRGDLTTAEDRMLRALHHKDARSSRRDTLLRSNLGIVRARLGRHRDAAADFRAALADDYLKPDDAARLWNLLAVSYRALGETQQARDAFRAALSASPREWQAGYNLARLQLAAGQQEAARRTLVDARQRALVAGDSPAPIDRLLDGVPRVQ